MAPKPFKLIYDTGVRLHLEKIEHKYHNLIRKAIEESLRVQPKRETLNRKPLLRPSILDSAWELRCGPDNRFRIFYRVNDESNEVYILAIGIKIREKLLIGGEVIEL